MAIDPPPKPATSRPIPSPGEPIYDGEPVRFGEEMCQDCRGTGHRRDPLKGSANVPLEPIVGKSETVPAEYEAPPTMAEYKALVESIRATLDKHYAQRIKLWVYFSVGVGVGIVLGILLGELIF